MQSRLESHFSDRFKVFFIFVTLITTLVMLCKPNLIVELTSYGVLDPSTLGWILTVNLFLLFAYSLKKREMMMSFGRLSGWYDFHFYLAVITFLLMFFHAGSVFGYGLSRWLVWVFLFILLNGFYGYLMHLLIPKLVLRRISMWYEPKQLNKSRDELIKQMEILASGKGGVFRGIAEACRFRKTLGLYSLGKSFFLSGDTLSFHLRFLAEKMKNIPDEERNDFHFFFKRYEDLIKINEQLFFIRVMNGWVGYHLLGVLMLVILMGAHIFTFFYF